MDRRILSACVIFLTFLVPATRADGDMSTPGILALGVGGGTVVATLPGELVFFRDEGKGWDVVARHPGAPLCAAVDGLLVALGFEGRIELFEIDKGALRPLVTVKPDIKRRKSNFGHTVALRNGRLAAADELTSRSESNELQPPVLFIYERKDPRTWSNKHFEGTLTESAIHLGSAIGLSDDHVFAVSNGTSAPGQATLFFGEKLESGWRMTDVDARGDSLRIAVGHHRLFVLGLDFPGVLERQGQEKWQLRRLHDYPAGAKSIACDDDFVLVGEGPRDYNLPSNAYWSGRKSDGSWSPFRPVRPRAASGAFHDLKNMFSPSDDVSFGRLVAVEGKTGFVASRDSVHVIDLAALKAAQQEP